MDDTEVVYANFFDVLHGCENLSLNIGLIDSVGANQAILINFVLMDLDERLNGNIKYEGAITEDYVRSRTGLSLDDIQKETKCLLDSKILVLDSRKNIHINMEELNKVVEALKIEI